MILILAVGGLAAIMFLAFAGGAFGSISALGQLPQGAKICDVRVVLSGYVTDANSPIPGVPSVKKVTDHNANIGISNCHPRGILEYNFALDKFALIGPGRATIYELITDKASQEWGNYSFGVDTDSFQTQKTFTEDHKFTKIPEGDYSLRVTDGWNSNVWTKTFTVKAP